MIRATDPVSEVVNAIVESRQLAPRLAKLVTQMGKSKAGHAIAKAIEARAVERWESPEGIRVTMTPIGARRFHLKCDRDARWILAGEREGDQIQRAERGGFIRETDSNADGPGFSMDRLADPRMLDAMASSLRFEANVARVRARYPEFFAATA